MLKAEKRDIPREYFEVLAEGAKKPRKTVVFSPGHVDHIKNPMFAHAGWFDRLVFYHNHMNGAYRELVFDPEEQPVAMSSD